MGTERMKIVKIETHVCNARMRNWIFVKVITDQDGLYGWGKQRLSGIPAVWLVQSKI